MTKIIITLSFLFTFEISAHISKAHDNLFNWGEIHKKKSPPKVIKKTPIVKRIPIVKRVPIVKKFRPIKTIRSLRNYMPETIAKPGECYGISYIEKKCLEISKRVISKDSYVERQIIPAVTKLITQKILMRKAFITEEAIPPLYEIVENKVLIKAAHTVWTKGNFTATQKIIGGDTYCLVQVPPKYRIDRKKVLRIKGSFVKKEIPLVYKEFKRLIVVKEESIKTKRIVPQRYKKVKMCLSNGGHYEWINILCSENATEDILIKIEKTLHLKGLLQKSFVDGIIDQDTEKALKKYQKNNSLKISGMLTIETVKKLGVEY